MAARVPFVGLTGGLGAGKTEALRALEELGAATLSTDAVVHELLQTEELRQLVADRFGADLIGREGLDRSKLAERAFAEPEDREWLEGQLWPRVGQQVSEWRDAIDRLDPAPRAAVVEVPLLFEAGMEGAFDHTLAVIADEQVRTERAGVRGHTALASRTGRQLSQDEKASRADFVVRNDGTLEELRQELSSVLATMEAG
jgi:dephospho-CoA kinase